MKKLAARFGSAAAVGALAAVASFANVPKAHAVCCVAYDYANAESNTRTITTDGDTNSQTIQDHFDDKLTQTENDLINALRLMSGQLTSNTTGQTQAESQMNDLKDSRQVQSNVESTRLSATMSATSGPSTCNVVTGTIAARALNGNSRDYNRALQMSFYGYDSGEVGAGNSGGRQGAIDKRQATHCSTWATAVEVAYGACAALGTDPGKDLRADTILGSPQDVLSTNDENAAVAFAISAGIAQPLGNIPSGLSKDQLRELGPSRNASIAVNSVATSILGDMISIRKPWVSGKVAVDGPTSGGAPDGLATWAQGTAAQMPEFTQGAENTSNLFPNGVSKLLAMRLHANRWIGNPNLLVGITDPVAAAKTSTEILANMTSQNFDQFQQTEKTNMLLAMILAIMEQDHRKSSGI